MDPDLQLVCQFAKWNPKIEKFKPKKARIRFQKSMQILSGKPISLPKVETTVIGNVNDAIKIRIYNPDPTRDNHPILVYLHGGGHTVGNLETSDGLCRYLAYRTPCMVFSIDYRLAPEFPFPIPLEDCYRAFQWVKSHAYRLGGNPDQIGVAGDSAGGNLAIGITTKLLAENQLPPKFTALLYPVADTLNESDSYEKFGFGFLLTQSLMRWFRLNYLKDPKDRANPLASPVYIEDFKNYPKMYLSTAGFDPLWDEGRALGEKFQKSNPNLVYSHFPSLLHGYANMMDFIPSCREAVEDFVKFLKTEWST